MRRERLWCDIGQVQHPPDVAEQKVEVAIIGGDRKGGGIEERWQELVVGNAESIVERSHFERFGASAGERGADPTGATVVDVIIEQNNDPRVCTDPAQLELVTQGIKRFPDHHVADGSADAGACAYPRRDVERALCDQKRLLVMLLLWTNYVEYPPIARGRAVLFPGWMSAHA